MTNDNRPRWELIKTYNKHNQTLHHWQVTDRDGDVRQVWSLQIGREDGPNGTKQIAAADRESLKERLREAIEERRMNRERQNDNTQTTAANDEQAKPEPKSQTHEGDLWHIKGHIVGIKEDGTVTLKTLAFDQDPRRLATRF